MHAARSTTRYARSTDVVWRAGPDRVVLRRIGAPSESGTDLMGDVAYVWIALDTPATEADVLARLADADIVVADLAAELARLADHQLITATSDNSNTT